jgi:hypothetical protein
LGFLDGIVNDFPNVKLTVTWTVSNITAGLYRHVCAVIDSPLMDTISKYLADCNFCVKRETIYIFHNAISFKSPDIAAKLLSKGLLDYIIDILSNDKDPSLLLLTLETLAFIINCGECFRNLSVNGDMGNPFLRQFELKGGSAILETLQNHQNEDVFKMASDILSAFFQTEAIN